MSDIEREAFEWRDIGDGKPVKVQRCPRCNVAPSNVDDCGEFGNPDCPYFGIGKEEFYRRQGAGEADPVAWTWRHGGRHVTADKPYADQLRADGVDVSPLYAHPPTATAGGVPEGWKTIIDRIVPDISPEPDQNEYPAEWSVWADRQRIREELSMLTAAPSPEPVCKTCNGSGRIGGPSYYAPDEGGELCPDCSAPSPEQGQAEAAADDVLDLRQQLDAKEEECRQRIKADRLYCMRHGGEAAQELAAENAELNQQLDQARDALLHIEKTCKGSRSQSRRLRWISVRARDGIDGTTHYHSVDLPKSAACSQEKYRIENIKLKLDLDAALADVARLREVVVIAQKAAWNLLDNDYIPRGSSEEMTALLKVCSSITGEADPYELDTDAFIKLKQAEAIEDAAERIRSAAATNADIAVVYEGLLCEAQRLSGETKND